MEKPRIYCKIFDKNSQSCKWDFRSIDLQLDSKGLCIIVLEEIVSIITGQVFMWNRVCYGEHSLLSPMIYCLTTAVIEQNAARPGHCLAVVSKPPDLDGIDVIANAKYIKTFLVNQVEPKDLRDCALLLNGFYLTKTNAIIHKRPVANLPGLINFNVF